ncbi:MAG: Uma2 family endonuclease [Pseudanabaenaceae cyanobacterium SKYGB_i_bin29]|nr:Uma2 family endonuclease [Pseudanabaenaceae cyanobacterium SKYG29]MDW8420412.1 Uma2 family endonuclease [Pseudanabaenaceae cyanobacterium SKYGB_i_bin29]
MVRTDCTAETYLNWEREALDRHEYLNGIIRPMPGGTPTYNQILLNLAISLKLKLPKGIYQVFVADQGLAIPTYNEFTYPGVMVARKPIQMYQDIKDTIVNPILVAEVLFPSTADYDRSDKFQFYQSIPTLKEYLLIEQGFIRVERCCQHDADQWLSKTFADREQKMNIDSLDITLGIEEIYTDVELEDEPRLTVTEYFNLDNNSIEWHEYINCKSQIFSGKSVYVTEKCT